MARLALTVVGGVIGSVIPGVGTAIGAAVGGMIGGLVETAMAPNTYGPRMEDTKSSPGTYGSPIAVVYGVGDLQADQIWVKGGKRDERKKSQSAGKGGPSFVTYQYFATFAVLMTDHQIAGVRRIYFGRDLVYDGTAELISAAISGGGSLPLTGAVEGLSFRIHTGTATQQPDPAIQAEDVHASGLRGMSYLVFEDVPLESWNGEIPPVFVEVLATAVAQRLDVGLAQYQVAANDGPGAASFDPVRGRMFVAAKSLTTFSDPLNVEIFDALAGEFERIDDPTGLPNIWFHPSTTDEPLTINEEPPQQVYNEVPPAPSPDGAFYVIAEKWHSQIWGGTGLVMDAETGQLIATIGLTLNYDATFSPERFGMYGAAIYHRLREVEWLPLSPTTGLQPFLYMRATDRGVIYLAAVSAGDRAMVYANTQISLSGVYGVGPEIVCDVPFDGSEIFIMYQDSPSSYKLARVPISGVAGSADLQTFGADLTVPWATNIGTLRGCYYNNEANTFFVWGDDGFSVYDRDLVEIKSVAVSNQTMSSSGADADFAGIIWFASKRTSFRDELVGYDTATGDVYATYDLTDWGMSDDDYLDPVWRLRGDIWVAHSETGLGGPTWSNRPVVFYGDRLALPQVDLADVLLDAVERAGMAASDLDLTAVTRTIYGAPHKSAGLTARGIWQDLLIQTGHESMIIDGKLTVKPRATTSSGTITEDDLGAGGGAPLMRRTDSSSPVRSVELTYKSTKANLETAIQRDEFPVEVVEHGNVVKLGTVVIMDDDQAWESVQRLLAAGAAESTEMEIRLPYTRADIELGSIWSVSTGGGVYDMRIESVSGASVLSVKGHAAYPFLAQSATPIDSTRGPPTLSEKSATEFGLIDAHIFRDTEDSAAFTLTAWPRRAALAWGGGVIYASDNPLSFNDEFSTVTVASVAASAEAGLGDIPSANFWDRANSVTVRMIAGTPESATEEEVLNGANPVWIACGATGEWELIQYAGAVENADGTWTLSTFLRGRRGTEHLTGSHLPGDRLVWAAAAAAQRVGGSAVGSERFYASATIGASQDLTTRRSFTNTARGLRPYSVVHPAGSRDGSGNLTITWVRRSRIHGDVSKTSLPLGEDSEAYEVDVMNGATVVRTISVSAATASYTAAEQTTDFGSAQDPLTVRIYQISGTYGRGVINEVSL